jgi:hypothetical protein
MSDDKSKPGGEELSEQLAAGDIKSARQASHQAHVLLEVGLCA